MPGHLKRLKILKALAGMGGNSPDMPIFKILRLIRPCQTMSDHVRVPYVPGDGCVVYDIYIYVWRLRRIRHAMTGIGSVPSGAAMRLSKCPHGESAVAILGDLPMACWMAMASVPRCPKCGKGEPQIRQEAR